MNKKNTKGTKKKKNIFSIFNVIFVIFIIIGIVIWGGLYKFNYAIGEDTSDTMTSDNNKESSVAKKEVVNILFCGENENLTDTIIYVKFNTTTNQISMLSVPRDTYITNKYAIGHKINSIYRGKNPTQLVDQVEELLDVKFDYYIVVSNKIVREIVDAIGGVEIDVPMRMKYDDPTQDLHINLQKGVQVLNGDKAEQFIRFRKNNDGSGYAGGDVERTAAQQKFIKAFIAKCLTPQNIVNIPKIIDIALDNTDTNLTAREALKYTTDVSKINTNNIKTFTAAGEGKYIEDISYFVFDKTGTQDIIKNKFDTVGGNDTTEDKIDDSSSVKN